MRKLKHNQTSFTDEDFFQRGMLEMPCTSKSGFQKHFISEDDDSSSTDVEDSVFDLETVFSIIPPSALQMFNLVSRT